MKHYLENQKFYVINEEEKLVYKVGEFETYVNADFITWELELVAGVDYINPDENDIIQIFIFLPKQVAETAPDHKAGGFHVPEHSQYTRSVIIPDSDPFRLSSADTRLHLPCIRRCPGAGARSAGSGHHRSSA